MGAMQFLLDDKITTDENLTAAVYVILKKNILNWNLKPGTKMSESETANVFSVSRTPVRESFKKLVYDGLIETRPQRGTYVTLINLSLMRQAHFVRESLESSVLRLAISANCLPAYEERLLELIKYQRKMLHEKKIDLFFEADAAFHNVFFEACGQNYAKQIASSANNDYLRLRYICTKNDPGGELLCDQHRELLDALRRGDCADAEHILHVHLNKINDDLSRVRALCPEVFTDN